MCCAVICEIANFHWDSYESGVAFLVKGHSKDVSITSFVQIYKKIQEFLAHNANKKVIKLSTRKGAGAMVNEISPLIKQKLPNLNIFR